MGEDSSPTAASESWEQRADELGTAFDLLSSQRRRYAIQYLTACDDDEVGLEELTAHVVDCSRSPDSATDSAPTHDAVSAELYHTHLPKLSEAGLATFDRSTGVVRLELLPDPVDRCLDFARAFDDRTSSG